MSTTTTLPAAFRVTNGPTQFRIAEYFFSGRNEREALTANWEDRNSDDTGEISFHILSMKPSKLNPRQSVLIVQEDGSEDSSQKYVIYLNYSVGTGSGKPIEENKDR